MLAFVIQKSPSSQHGLACIAKSFASIHDSLKVLVDQYGFNVDDILTLYFADRMGQFVFRVWISKGFYFGEAVKL